MAILFFHLVLFTIYSQHHSSRGVNTGILAPIEHRRARFMFGLHLSGVFDEKFVTVRYSGQCI
jgi:hypothetical protein